MEFAEKFAIGGLKPISTPDGTELVFMCRIEHIAGFINIPSNDIIDPQIQREIDGHWVAALSDQIEQDFLSGNGSFGIINMAYNATTNEYSVLNGQHRIQVMSHLLKQHEFMADKVAYVHMKVLTNEDTINKYWMSINTSKPVQLLPCVQKQELVNTLRKFFTVNFPKYISTSKAPKRPNFNLERLTKIITDYGTTKHNDLLCQSLPDSILKMNKYLSTQTNETLKTWLTNDSYSLIGNLQKGGSVLWYCGLYPMEDIICTSIDMTINNRKVSDMNFRQNKRCNPTRQLRLGVWKKRNDGNKKIGTCFVCSSRIDFRDFHCSHIIPRIRLGGELELHNLEPCCPSCNIAMGTQNLLQFKRQNYGEIPTALPVESSACPK